MQPHTPLRRKLAAILAADVVGYSKKMGQSEERTLRNLKQCRAITDASITTHHGRIFHTAGDSVIAEFASPVDAVMAAIEFQKHLFNRNAACDPADHMEFRVGLNLGDVIVEGDNLYGDGINIAARIESIAVPGGICIAQSVFAVVRKKIDGVEFVSRGLQTLKNIEEPLEVFDFKDASLTPLKPEPTRQPDAVGASGLKPIVAVEPFSTAGGDQDIGILAVGLRDGIVSSLMKSSAVLVVKQADATTALAPGSGLGQISFKVSGSIQAAGAKCRIFITLENAASGAQIWSKRFDTTSEDIFAIQDQIVQKINQDIRHKIKEANFERLEALPDTALAVPDLLDKAAGYFVRDGRNALGKAEQCLDLALALEPDHSMAMGMKAQCLDWRSELSPYPITQQAAAAHFALLDQAIQRDPRNYYALALKAEQQCYAGAFQESIRTADLALRVFPDFDQAKAIKTLANFHIAGDIQVLEAGKRLRYFCLTSLALAWFSADVRDKALEEAELVFERFSGMPFPELCASVVISTYREDGLGHPKVQRFLSSHPDLTPANCRKPVFGNAVAAVRFDTALEKLLSFRP